MIPNVSNNRQLDCLLSNAFGLTAKKISKLCITGHLWGESHKGAVLQIAFPSHDVIMAILRVSGQTDTESEMSSFWWNFHHWLHWKLSKWQLPVQPVIKISSKWRHFRFSGPGTQWRWSANFMDRSVWVRWSCKTGDIKTLSLTPRDQVTHIYVRKLEHHWFI